MSGNGLDNHFGDWYLLNLEVEKLLASKKKKDLIEELFKPEKNEPEKIPSLEASDFIENRIKDLKGTMDQINKEIYLRFEMKNKFDTELDYQISRAAFSLGQFKFWGLGYNTGVDVKRNMLERQLADFRREKRRIELQDWEDIIGLRKDLRKVLDEYKMLITRKEAMM
jgi:hypothetical protein